MYRTNKMKSIANHREFLINGPSTMIYSQHRPQTYAKLKIHLLWRTSSEFPTISIPNPFSPASSTLLYYNVHHRTRIWNVCVRCDESKITYVKQRAVIYMATQESHLMNRVMMHASTWRSFWEKSDKFSHEQRTCEAIYKPRRYIRDTRQQEDQIWEPLNLLKCDHYLFYSRPYYFKALTRLLL